MLTYNDTVNTFTAYATPKVTETLVGVGQLIPTLDGGVVLAYQFRQDGDEIDVRLPRCITVEWADLAPKDLQPMVIDAWRRQRPVTITWPLASNPAETDTITGYLPADKAPEYEPTGAGCIRLKFIIQEASI